VLEEARQVVPRADAELAVRAREVDLHRLRGDVERLGDVAVALAAGREGRNTLLARRQRADARECFAARSDAGRAQLGADLLDERRRFAGARELERASQRLSRLARAPRQPKDTAVRRQRLGQLEPRG
jgi:hypothetical protein